MNKPLRHIWLVVSVLFILLFTSTTYFQVVAQERLNADGRNVRTIYNEWGPAPRLDRGGRQGDRVLDPHGRHLRLPALLRSGRDVRSITGYYSVVYGFSGSSAR